VILLWDKGIVKQRICGPFRSAEYKTDGTSLDLNLLPHYNLRLPEAFTLEFRSLPWEAKGYNGYV
jgi:hypothetical protein